MITTAFKNWLSGILPVIYLVGSYSSVVACQQGDELIVKSFIWFFCSKQDPLESSVSGQTWNHGTARNHRAMRLHDFKNTDLTVDAYQLLLEVIFSGLSSSFPLEKRELILESGYVHSVSAQLFWNGGQVQWEWSDKLNNKCGGFCVCLFVVVSNHGVVKQMLNESV